MSLNAAIICSIWDEGGDQGGQLVAEGTPEEIALNPASYTGFYLREVLKVERKEFCQV